MAVRRAATSPYMRRAPAAARSRSGTEAGEVEGQRVVPLERGVPVRAGAAPTVQRDDLGGLSPNRSAKARPPNNVVSTTARLDAMASTPSTPRAGHCTRHRRRARRPAAARAGPAAQRADHDGVDLRRGRRPGVRPLRQPDLDRVRGRARARWRAAGAWRTRPGMAAVTSLLDLVGAGRQGGRAAALLQRHPGPARRPRAARPAHRDAGRHHRHRGRRRGVRGRRAGLVRVADQPGARGGRRPGDHRRGPRRRRPRRRRQHVPHPAAAASRSSSAPTSSLHSATKYLSGHSDVQLGAIVTRDEELYAVLKGRRDVQGNDSRSVRGVAGAARPAHPAPARRARPGERRRAGPPPRRPPAARPRSATPASARMVSIVLPTADQRRPAGARHRAVGARHQPRRRRVDVRAPPPLEVRARDHPRGLVRLSVGIEDVEDLWADLGGALDSLAGRLSPSPALVSRERIASIMSCAVIRPATTSSTYCATGASTPVRSASARSEAHDLAPSAT